MDFIKSLMKQGNLEYLQRLSETRYPILDEDSDEDKAWLDTCRREFVETYHKQNNRQFLLAPHRYRIADYLFQVEVYESRNNLDHP